MSEKNQKSSDVLKTYRALPDFAADVGLSQPMWTALCNTYPGVSDDMIMAVHEYCLSRKLDPLKKPVHVVPMYVEHKGGGGGRMMELVMPGITELRITASRTGVYAGQDEVEFGPMIEVPVNSAKPDGETITAPQYARVTVYRLVGGKTKAGWTHIEFFAEAVARTRAGLINSMWTKRPRGQLAKCAEAGALRKAFPEELGGIMSADEMIGRDEIDHGSPQQDAIPEPAEITEHAASAVAAGGQSAPSGAAETKVAEVTAMSSTEADLDDIPEPTPVAEKQALDAVADASAKAATVTRYWRHPESESLFTTKPGDEPTDPLCTELSRAEYVAAVKKEADRNEAEKARVRAEVEARAAAQLAAENNQPASTPGSVPSTQGALKVELAGGALSIINSHLQRAGITMDQLLAKLGSDLTVRTINEALAILKSWGK